MILLNKEAVLNCISAMRAFISEQSAKGSLTSDFSQSVTCLNSLSNIIETLPSMDLDSFIQDKRVEIAGNLIAIELENDDNDPDKDKYEAYRDMLNELQHDIYEAFSDD